MATLQELETSWSIDDVERAAAALAVSADMVKAVTPKPPGE